MSFIEATDSTKPWCRATQGPGRALFAAIDSIADESGARELHTAPLVLAGVCEAGQFAYEFSAYAPDRSAAFLTIGGGKHDVSLANKAAIVPGALIAATDRGDNAVNNMLTLFAAGRKQSAPWLFSMEQIADYDHGQCSKLAAAFLEATLQSIHSEPKRVTRHQPSSDIKLPLKQLVISQYPEGVTTLIETAGRDDLSCWFPDRGTANEWLTRRDEPNSSSFSFAGVPLPVLGSVTPERVSLGTILLGSGSATEFAALFDVQCGPETAADGITVLTDQKSVVSHVGKDKWRVECKFNPNSIPSGAFRTEIPIRFTRKGKTLLGGVSAFIEGRVTGDIRPDPIAINVGNANSGNSERYLHLLSRSGSKIEITSIESSFPTWAKALVEQNNGVSVTIRCSFNPPPDLTKTSFSGNFLIRAKSDRAQVIKLLFYGTVSPEGNK